MDSIEARLDALEGEVRRYRNAAVVLGLVLAGVLLVGATTDDGIQDVVRTRALVVLNEAGEGVFHTGTDSNGNGFLTVRSRTTAWALIHAGVDGDGNGSLRVKSKTGKELISKAL